MRSNCLRGVSRGFTLLEILVALVVVAVALTAAIRLTSQTALTTSVLRDKTYANWVAGYVAAEYRLMDPVPIHGGRSGTLRMGTRDWPWEARLEATEDKAVDRLTIKVELDDVQHRLVAFLARPEPAP